MLSSWARKTHWALELERLGIRYLFAPERSRHAAAGVRPPAMLLADLVRQPCAPLSPSGGSGCLTCFLKIWGSPSPAHRTNALRSWE